MTKPLRSPVVGYNHNLRYRGRLFHVQSEDSGPVNPHVFTHLFYEGTILSSKKLQYDAESHEDAVRVQMQQLHKAMIKELTHGDHDTARRRLLRGARPGGVLGAVRRGDARRGCCRCPGCWRCRRDG